MMSSSNVRYPQFEKITLKHKPLFDKLLNQIGPSGDYKFPSLWSYNTKNDAEISIFEENIIVVFRDYVTNNIILTCNGTNSHSFEELIQKTLEEAKKRSGDPVVYLVPEHIAHDANVKKQKYRIVEDRDSFDYIHSLTELAELRGGKYHTQKNHLNRFNKLYPEAKAKDIDISSSQTQKAIFELFDKWEHGKKKSSEDTTIERKALQRMVSSAHIFKLYSLGLYYKNTLIGFSITDLEEKETAQNHFAKSDPLYKEVYFKLMNEGAKVLLEKGYEYLNIENDMGIPGLRYAKEQWNPVKYIKKYSISYRD